MHGLSNFAKCMAEQLEAKGFGEKRRDEILDRFNGLTEFARAAGQADPEIQAMTQVFKELAQAKADKNRMALATLMKSNDMAKRTSGKETVAGASFGVRGLGEGVAGYEMNAETKAGIQAARSAISMIEDDPRFKGSNFSTQRRIARDALWAVANDVVENIGKGAFGRQKGTAHMPNVVREAFGEATGDRVAADVATGWRKATDAGVDMFNSAGGAQRKLAEFHLPQRQSAAKMLKQGFDEWARDWAGWADWAKMQHPNGAPIQPGERAAVLKDVFDTLASGGMNKRDPSQARGMGAAVGNMTDEHRFLVLKDAGSWLAMHDKYGEGTVFDVMKEHIERMGDRIALVQMFGPNPEAGLTQLKAYAQKSAYNAAGPQGQAVADTVLKTTFDPMVEKILHKNPLDPNSYVGAAVTSTTNILTASQLGSAAIPAVLGDFFTSASVDAFNKTGRSPFGGLERYLKTLMFDRAHQERIAAQSGFIAEEAISSTYAATRFGLTTTYGPAISRRIADGVLRASLMTGHTQAARWTMQAEMMGLLARSATTSFDELPFARMMQRAGITAGDWDKFRAHGAWTEPKGGAQFLRPIDVLQAGGEENARLFRLFQGMILDESRRGVPESTIEGAVMLKGTNTPDTLVGSLVHSFSMYKNFPVSMMMIYGRLAMSEESGLGRLGLLAGLGAGMMLTGALATQLKEIAKGHDPMPMGNAKFLGAAAMTGGAMGIWGDFLFSDVNRMGNSLSDTAAGPLFGFANDARKLAFGDALSYAGLKEGDHFKGMKLPGRAVEFAKRYLPGSNLWYARLALEREVYDRLQMLADPSAYRKMNERVRKQRKEVGNDFFWPPGQTALPSRGPDLSGAFQ